jgi:hypothetical protein
MKISVASPTFDIALDSVPMKLLSKSRMAAPQVI